MEQSELETFAKYYINEGEKSKTCFDLGACNHYFSPKK